MKLRTFLVLFYLSAIISKSTYGLEALSINSEDRILIVAPHPDDEILACAGLIQQALQNKAEVNVLYLTEGEHNRVSLFYYQKRFFVKSRQDYINLGKTRKEESIIACSLLGLKRGNLYFLDYPDSGIYKIFLKHWAEVGPYQDTFTQLSYTPAGEGITPLASFKGESILLDLKKILLKLKPSKIFIPHFLDEHPDHLGTYLFLKLALWELKPEIQPEQFLYLVHWNKFSLLEHYSWQ